MRKWLVCFGQGPCACGVCVAGVGFFGANISIPECHLVGFFGYLYSHPLITQKKRGCRVVWWEWREIILVRLILTLFVRIINNIHFGCFFLYLGFSSVHNTQAQILCFTKLNMSFQIFTTSHTICPSHHPLYPDTCVRRSKYTFLIVIITIPHRYSFKYHSSKKF
jgi:hypothetical protein